MRMRWSTRRTPLPPWSPRHEGGKNAAAPESPFCRFMPAADLCRCGRRRLAVGRPGPSGRGRGGAGLCAGGPLDGLDADDNSNPWSRPGTPLEKIDGIVIHYVGNPGTTAKANRNYFESLSSGETETYASSHFIVGLEGEVIQCIPLTEIAYASNIRNEDTVAIEVCHPDETGAFSPAAYQQVVELTAWLCRTFDLDPDTDVIRHYDVTEKLCPLYYVEHPEAWDAFRADVAAEMERQTEVS